MEISQVKLTLCPRCRLPLALALPATGWDGAARRENEPGPVIGRDLFKSLGGEEAAPTSALASSSAR